MANAFTPKNAGPQPGRGARDASAQAAYEYGRNGEPLPEVHVYAALTALDEAYMSELHELRARQEVQEREISGLATRLAAPLEEESAGTGGFWRRIRGRRAGGSPHFRNGA